MIPVSSSFRPAVVPYGHTSSGLLAVTSPKRFLPTLLVYTWWDVRLVPSLVSLTPGVMMCSSVSTLAAGLKSGRVSSVPHPVMKLMASRQTLMVFIWSVKQIVLSRGR